jgi:hypothetical protein
MRRATGLVLVSLAATVRAEVPLDRGPAQLTSVRFTPKALRLRGWSEGRHYYATPEAVTPCDPE